jgi:hypothetical protein
MKKGFKITIYTLSGLLGLAGCLWLWSWGFLQMPPLATSSPFGFAVSETVFQKRVQNRFPVGSKAYVLETELLKQGFKIAQPQSDSEYRAVFHLSGFPCNKRWTVLWRNDAIQNIASIDASHGLTCL